MVYTFNSITEEVAQADICESKVSLVYVASFMPARVIYWDPVDLKTDQGV